MANSMARSFLQVAATEEVASPLRVVQIEGLVILKIIKHCKEFSPALVTGQLLGLDVGSVLEVTNCFPFPIREEDEEIEADGANYQLEMMRCLREVNVDNNTVGWFFHVFGGFLEDHISIPMSNYVLDMSASRKMWSRSNIVLYANGVRNNRTVYMISESLLLQYQSTILGSYQTVELIETFMNYQENIRRCVCIIYDPSRSNQGVLALKALKLSDSFMELYRANNFTGEKYGFSLLSKAININFILSDSSNGLFAVIDCGRKTYHGSIFLRKFL
ncbi:hypothetical protein Golob_011717 [Gossypium lobatum]|uniref:MPN domain-containing protein n=1 Tax=Gossypium lobatum TaxID=34289 RepID=A0A7J8MQF4_9ROSI|nr:hypothetical protein [Gossypium lobatum]